MARHFPFERIHLDALIIELTFEKEKGKTWMNACYYNFDTKQQNRIDGVWTHKFFVVKLLKTLK